MPPLSPPLVAVSLHRSTNKQHTESDALVEAAFKLYEAGQFEEALVNAAEAKKLSKNDFRPYTITGLVWLSQHKTENASREFSSAIRLQPKRKELHALKPKADAGHGAQYNLVKAMVQYLADDDKNLARELAKLGQLDESLAKEMEEYRKTYEGALIASPLKHNE